MTQELLTDVQCLVMGGSGSARSVSGSGAASSGGTTGDSSSSGAGNGDVVSLWKCRTAKVDTHDGRPEFQKICGWRTGKQ